VLCVIVLGGTAALSYDGIKRRLPLPTVFEGSENVDLSSGLAELKMPGPIAIKMGKTSPGQCIFIHARHVDQKNPNCSTCHAGLFRMLPSTADIAPDRKMTNCGTCHDGVKAVGVRQKERCDSCHAKS
jgi:c(7)-type cytochrome triheme protein